MKKQKSETNYLESFTEYQDKMFMPGYYVGGKIHPALKAKTKAGGYLMVIGGVSLLSFYLFIFFQNFALENISVIIPIAFALLLIMVGIKFIKLNSQK